MPRQCTACKRTAPDVTFYGTSRVGRCKECWRAYMRERDARKRMRASADMATLTAHWGRR